LGNKGLENEPWLGTKTEESRRSRRKPSIWWKALLLLLGAYLIINLIVYLLQNWILYQPGRYSLAELVAWSELNKVVLWPDQGAYRGLISKEEPAKIRGTVIVFHGNAGSVIDRFFYFGKIDPLGYLVLLHEYPGYGSRSGKADEQNIVQDSIQTVLQAEKQFGRPIYLIGESLGAGVVAALAGEIPNKIDGILLITPWDSLSNLTQSKLWFVPARLILKNRYDSVANLEKYTGPVGIVMAGDDEVVPNKLTLRLYNSVQRNGHLWIIPHANHNTWVLSVSQQWWNRVFSFLEGKTVPGGISSE
jgi:alpha-beta hydrolase superfamily lysophospholipase